MRPLLCLACTLTLNSGCNLTQSGSGTGTETGTSPTTLDTAPPQLSSTTSPTTETEGTTHGTPTTSAATSASSGSMVSSGTSSGGNTTDESSTTTTSSTTTSSSTTSETDTGGAWTPKACPEIYAQELLPTFELTISADELAEIQQEWLLADDDKVKEHPVELFTYEDTQITNASVRLRGNSSHWSTQGKMQFEVSFNTYDETARFMGLKHILFDAAEYNRSFLRDRLALAIMRDVGLPAPCANNSKLILNGEYYGLFTNIEKVDAEFLERTFEAPDGNLYKRQLSGNGWKKKTNEEDPSESDVDKLNAAKTIPDLLAVMNLDQALLEWAAEAIIPDRDGAWAGGLNLYVYNDPKTGFNVIPWDLDDSFTRLTPDTDPYTYRKPLDHGRPFYDLATADPVWFQKYIATLDFVLTTGYDPVVLQARIDTWAAQIADAVADDPNRPFTLKQHKDKVKEKRKFVADRAAFVATWLECWKQGGTKTENGLCKPP